MEKYHGDGPVPLWIDNEPVTSDKTFTVTNAGTGASIQAYGATPSIATRAVESSHRAFQTWRRSTPWERRDLLLRAAQLLEERREAAEAILQVESSIDDFTRAGINMAGSIDLLKELAANVLQASTGTVLPSKIMPGMQALVMREPVGVQLGVAPWNVSLLLGLRAVATPIACGNTAVLKASEKSPLAHHFIGRLFRDAGFPPGVLNIIQHAEGDGPDVVGAMIGDVRVRKVNFTGSAAVGRLVAASAATHGKPALLELGGKSPQIVLPDADLDAAAGHAVMGAFAHHGQICMSTERIIVHERIIEAFTAKLQAAAAQYAVQPGVSKEQVDKVERLVSAAVAQGAQLLGPGGNSLHRDANNRITPRILTGVKKDMDIWKAETFGPVSILVPFKTLDEAVELANDGDYGLSASVFSANVPLAMDVARRLDSGAVHINSMTVHDEAHLPHGGSKQSGWGRFGAPWGFAEFTQLKTITIAGDTTGGVL